MKILFLLVLAMPFPSIASEYPFSISVDSQNTTSARAFGSAPVQQDGVGKVTARVEGIENSECRPYGRRSSAEASADVEVIRRDNDSIALLLASGVSAYGGHYRSCGGCVLNNCIGIFGNDTKGQSNATSKSRVTIRFNSNFPASNYIIDVATSVQSSALRVTFSDHQGRELRLRDEKGGPSIVRVEPGAVYYLTLELPVGAESEGGCCDDRKSASARVDIGVLKAPILSSLGKLEPYIFGGEQTTAFEPVGALLLDGRLHCTGTLIGEKTVLTAAHCLNGYEKQIDKMTFILGANLLQPINGPLRVSDISYPNGSPPGYSFNPKTLEDDIGLVYIDKTVPMKAYGLHKGSPGWGDLLNQKTSLTFVGFGYDVIEDQKIGAGIKREASWAIDGVENRRVTFHVKGRSTCKGDSGGPAFIKFQGALVIAAVTSGGDKDCSRGFQSRIDSFLPWLEGRVR